MASEHVAHAKAGMPVKVWVQGRPEFAIIGAVRQISPEADSTTGTYEVKVALPSPPPEMRLGAVVVGRAETDGPEVISVPSNALLQSGDGPQVWVVAEDGAVRRQAVEIVEFSADSVVVSRGLSAGEKVVTAGVNSLAEGQPVKPEMDGKSGARAKPAGQDRDGEQVMTRFNLSEWAVNNKAIVVFLMLLCAVAGVGAYDQLGRQEDPDFSVQTMVVQVAWPGATALDTLKQVTDRLEKKLEETPRLDYIKSYTKPGQSTIFVYLKESTPKRDLPDIWYQVRKKVGDVQAALPKGVIGPFFNDEFGDVFGIVYGVTYDGFTPREARDFAETARAEFLRASDVGKVDIFGDQDEKIYLDFSPQKLANLKLNLDDVLTAIAQQNAVVPVRRHQHGAGERARRRHRRPHHPAEHRQPEPLGEQPLLQTDRHRRRPTGYIDPPTKMFRVNGKPAIGIGVNMASGGNNLAFGEGLHEVGRTTYCSACRSGSSSISSRTSRKVVKEALGGFTKALLEAIAIVLAVSFLSLGLRAGVVVALSIPLVLAIVFVGMKAMDISLQRISLGALIIALGLLVDDAMITIEMMISKIEEGMEKVKAATFAYTSTAFPMLTGTLITIFGFLPIGFADNNTGQYTFSLFAVIAIALVASWFVAVIFAPVIGLVMLPSQMKAHHAAGPGRFIRAFGQVLGYQHAASLAARSPPRSSPSASPSTASASCSSSSSRRRTDRSSWSRCPCPRTPRSRQLRPKPSGWRRLSPATPTSPASPPMSAAAPSASTCRSTCSSTTTSWRRSWSSQRISRPATGCRRGSRRFSPMTSPM